MLVTEQTVDHTMITIDEIEIRERVRKDMGDIEGLANNIATSGLLQPILLTSDYVLIDGARRIAAMRHLGSSTIRAQVVNVEFSNAAMLLTEIRANQNRKDFLPSELVAMASVIKAAEEELAHERMREGGKKGKPGKGASPDAPFQKSKDRAADRVARALGTSASHLQRSTYIHANGIHALTEAHDAGKIGDMSAYKIAKLPEVEQEQVLQEKLNPSAPAPKEAEPSKPTKVKGSQKNLESVDFTYSAASLEGKILGLLIRMREVVGQPCAVEALTTIRREVDELLVLATNKRK